MPIHGECWTWMLANWPPYLFSYYILLPFFTYNPKPLSPNDQVSRIAQWKNPFKYHLRGSSRWSVKERKRAYPNTSGEASVERSATDRPSIEKVSQNNHTFPWRVSRRSWKFCSASSPPSAARGRRALTRLGSAWLPAADQPLFNNNNRFVQPKMVETW